MRERDRAGNRRAGGCAGRTSAGGAGGAPARSSLLGGSTGASCGVSSRVLGVGTYRLLGYLQGNCCGRGRWGTAPSPGELGQGGCFCGGGLGHPDPELRWWEILTQNAAESSLETQRGEMHKAEFRLEFSLLKVTECK